MARDPSAYDRQARAMEEIAQACGQQIPAAFRPSRLPR
jgi:hypothetical protein